MRTDMNKTAIDQANLILAELQKPKNKRDWSKKSLKALRKQTLGL